MDLFTFITIITIASLIFVAYIINKEAATKRAIVQSEQGDNSEQIEVIMSKLDNVLKRVETLERLATDEDHHLQRRFDQMSKKPDYA